MLRTTVSVRNTQVRVGIDKEKTVQTVREIQKILMASKELSSMNRRIIIYRIRGRFYQVEDFAVDVWYCSDSKIRELNHDFRGIRKSTDVLSFPVCEFDKPGDYTRATLLIYSH